MNTSMMISVAKTMEPWISLRRLEHDVQRGVLLAFRLGAVLAQAADDVLDDDDRVVHQRAERDGHAAQGHGVDRRAERLHRQDGRHQRQRDGDQGDRRRARREQEGEDDGDDQHRRRRAAPRTGCRWRPG